MAQTVDNIRIEPCYVYWGKDTAQVELITCVADVASSLNNKYFFIYSAGTKYHVWFNVATAGTDPAPAGSTAVVVALSANAGAGTVATAVASAIDALAGAVATASGAVVTMTQAAVGYVSPAHEGSGSGFAFDVSVRGDTEVEVGYTDKNIEISTEESLLDITTHQQGETVVGAFKKGKKVEVTINLKETSIAQIKKVLRQASDTYTPVGAAATELVGWGTYGNFDSAFKLASRLRLHPTRLLAADKSRDWTFFKVYPKSDKFSLSGEDILVLPLSFKCYPDLSINSRINIFAFGDSSQTLT